MRETESQSHSRRAPRLPRGLLALNAVLLAALGAVTLTPRAGAQSGLAGAGSEHIRVRGEYALVGGLTLGDTASTIYVLDSANRELLALRWNDSTKGLEGVGYRDLVRDANSDPDR